MGEHDRRATGQFEAPDRLGPVKGKYEPVACYELIGAKEQISDRRRPDPGYSRAMALYRTGDFAGNGWD